MSEMKFLDKSKVTFHAVDIGLTKISISKFSYDLVTDVGKTVIEKHMKEASKCYHFMQTNALPRYLFQQKEFAIPMINRRLDLNKVLDACVAYANQQNNQQLQREE